MKRRLAIDEELNRAVTNVVVSTYEMLTLTFLVIAERKDPGIKHFFANATGVEGGRLDAAIDDAVTTLPWGFDNDAIGTIGGELPRLSQGLRKIDAFSLGLSA